MIELPLVFVAGILGTAHCLGMCGPLALAIGSGARGWSDAFARQSVYTAGRVFTYGVLGAAAGFGGWRLAHTLPTLINIPAILAILAGLLLIQQGLAAIGWWPRRLGGHTVGSGAGCLAGGLFAPLFRERSLRGVFLAGLFTGLLPCGLLYGMLALAASSHSVVQGGVTMVVFGLGTAPAMILAGTGGRLLGVAARRRLLAAAAWCLIVTGIVSAARGAMFLSIGSQPAIGCPACHDSPLPTR
jgi:sulfite exporter TauE/SafE